MVTDYMKEHTFVVTFANRSNGLEAKVECISLNHYTAEVFVRRQHKFHSWEFVSCKKKYK